VLRHSFPPLLPHSTAATNTTATTATAATTTITVKYGYGFCATRTVEWIHCKLQTRPLVREAALHEQDRKFQTETFRQEVISGRKSHKGARYVYIEGDGAE
jgi:hypothetical protein